ncbi:phosphoenolpyruvate carboxykinase [Candidatus Bipolaricaulota bacterium]|nr:phosphoenolpyruvate carboxykinase [Candidatus Bipolaricaulota bacterium]
MQTNRLTWARNQALLNVREKPCQTEKELLQSNPAHRVILKFIEELKDKDSRLLQVFPKKLSSQPAPTIAERLHPLLIKLLDQPLEEVGPNSELGKGILERREKFHQFIERLYDFWRDYTRFIIKWTGYGSSEEGTRPYLQFNKELDELTELVRSAYRSIAENITRTHPIVYRQVSAGFEVGLAVDKKEFDYPDLIKEKFGQVPVIEQVTIEPPFVIDPPMNKRTGMFREADSNPISGADINPQKWLCYPAKVGDLRIDVFFHQDFTDLGTSLANLFELATGEELENEPDAVYAYGLAPEHMEEYGDLPTVFYQDEENDLLYGALPREPRFGYFGYVKKMMLTLHNTIAMDKGRMPLHGAMTRIFLRGLEDPVTLAIMGGSGAGKSETLEAFRVIGEDLIQETEIICDDMGSLGIGESGDVLGYGTETGAFVRLDDLQKGYAFSQLDRSIFMSPQRTNARALMPVAPIEKVLEGMPIDYFFYANNFEEVDEEHPIIERLDSPEEAISVFSEGARMSKGTTSETGLSHTYFANPFGPAQFKEKHDEIAEKFFEQFYETQVFVGQLRTRLGISGMETEGPQQAARELLQLLKENGKEG